MPECRRFRVRGRVQGVWFRESTRQQAELNNITGYAHNCPDGSVDVLACGPSASLDELKKWLAQGPPMAKVAKLEEHRVEASCPDGFSTGWSPDN